MQLTKKVLVLGDNDLASLATVRSLGRAGLEVHLVAWYDYAITRSSRYVKALHHCGHPVLEPHHFAARILQLVQEISFDFVIPVLDDALIPLLHIEDILRRHCVFAAPNHRQFEMAHNKGETIRLAQQLGIAIPTTTVVTHGDQIPSISWPEHFPIILKPALGGRVRKATTVSEAEQRLEQMLKHGPVLVQEFCPGRGVGVDILSHHGTLHAAFQHERVHEPPEGGVSSYRKSVPLSEDLLTIARRMCEALQWTGPAMFEFKADPATGRTVLMEINGRLWGSLALSIAAGVDFPKLTYDLLVKNEPVNVFSYRTPYFARNTRRDFFWFFDNLKAPKNHPQLLKVRWPALARELAHVVLRREHWDAEQLSDPLPGLLSWLEVGREVTARLSGKLNTMRGRYMARRMAALARAHDPQLLRTLREARSVLFLCQGNIHRSAFAEQQTRKNRHWGDEVQISSAGFLPNEGRATSQHSLKVAKILGVDLSRHRSKTVTEEMLAHADLIFVMDLDQLLQLRALKATAIQKTVLLGALDPQTSDWEIADPDGKSQDVYQRTYAKISRCIETWLKSRNEVTSRNKPDDNYSIRLLSTAK